MRAALLERVNDVGCDFIDARGNRVADRRNFQMQIYLHARKCVPNLFELTREIFALGGDIVQQSADADFIIAIGTLKR